MGSFTRELEFRWSIYDGSFVAKRCPAVVDVVDKGRHHTEKFQLAKQEFYANAWCP